MPSVSELFDELNDRAGHLLIIIVILSCFMSVPMAATKNMTQFMILLGLLGLVYAIIGAAMVICILDAYPEIWQRMKQKIRTALH